MAKKATSPVTKVVRRTFTPSLSGPDRALPPTEGLPKPSSLVDTRVIYCGDNLEQSKELPEACVDFLK